MAENFVVKTHTSAFGIRWMVRTNQIITGNYQIVIVEGNTRIKYVSERQISNL